MRLFRRFSEGLRSHTLLVHIRKATVGAVEPINSHPFRYGIGCLRTTVRFWI